MSVKITPISNPFRIIGIRSAVFKKASTMYPPTFSYDQYLFLGYWVGAHNIPTNELPKLTLEQKTQVARIFERSLVPDTARLPKGSMPGLAEYQSVLREAAKANRQTAANHRRANVAMAAMAGRSS